jgi:hypothetical protein
MISFLLAPIAALSATQTFHPQQLLYQAQSTLANGERVGIFLPAIPVALGLQSKSGSRVLVIGDLLHCVPFEEKLELFRKTPGGDFEAFTTRQELLNCGPPAPGGVDRILAVVGIRWNE